MPFNLEKEMIFFDESGFTGENLLSPTQEHFVYSSVKCTESEAREVVVAIKSKHKLQGDELKGSRLVKSAKGQRAVMELLEIFENRTLSVAMDKKFALAGKFFEYIFEPVIAEKSTLFYGTGFHLFVANLLYLDFLMRPGETAEKIFCDFETVMRSRSLGEYEVLFSNRPIQPSFPPLKDIMDFAYIHKDRIGEEMIELGAWTLDLTSTSLMTLLSDWSQRHGEVTAVCDNSKPLLHQQDLFDTMVGREETGYMNLYGQKEAITCNLSEPLIMADSRTIVGIQIADAVAGAIAYALNENNTDAFAVGIRERFGELLGRFNIFPDLDFVNLENTVAQINAAVLMELHARSRSQADLLEGMEHFLFTIKSRLSI